MKLKYFVCCGHDIYKKVIVAIIVTTSKDGTFEYIQNLFQPSNLFGKTTTEIMLS